MSDPDINKMNFKQLKNEVQLLRDELAIFKRKYEDAIYNLDSDNFGKSFTVEQNNMKAQIKITADAIKTMVSDTDLAAELEKYSTIEQTANRIQAVVSKSANLDKAVLIDSLDNATDTEAIYIIQQKDNNGTVLSETYYYFNNVTNRWEILSGDSIYTVFNQTAEGFALKGNVLIDGNAVVTKNLTLSGNVTWDMDNSPVQTRYSSDNLNWHSPMVSGDMYMQMSFDGGVSWSTPTKVVGTDGKDGWDGSDANVTPENVFNALTDSGAQQGIFAAFVNNDNKIYINAEYLATKIAEVAEILYVGGEDSNEQKMIKFNNAASVGSYKDYTGNPPTGISISGSSVRFLGLGATNDTSPYIYVNGMLLATQDWVKENAGKNAARLYAENYPSGYYVKLQLSDGDFGLFSPSAGTNANATDTECVWGILHSAPDADEKTINYYAFGTNYLGFNNTQQKTYPKGSWDFQGFLYYKGKLVATREWVEGRIAEISTGGTVTAVFG